MGILTCFRDFKKPLELLHSLPTLVAGARGQGSGGSMTAEIQPPLQLSSFLPHPPLPNPGTTPGQCITWLGSLCCNVSQEDVSKGRSRKGAMV